MTARPGIHARLALARPGFTLDVDLHLPGSGVTALFGPSGCGKTTCLRAIAGLERARGRVAVQHSVWQDDAERAWQPTHARGLGYVFQEASLFEHLSVHGNIAYGLRRTPPARRAVALPQVVDLLGIAHLMDRRPNALSGGERQRVAIARALATAPRLLLMDEPLAALDAQRKAEVLPYLERLHQALDIPILYVSHAIDEVVRLAEHVVLLDHGRALASGPLAQVMARPDLPLGQGDGASALVVGQVERVEEAFHLLHIAFPGGRLQLVQNAPLPLHALHTPVRVRVLARDVSLSLPAPQPAASSVLNTLPARITGLHADGPGFALATLDVGGTTLLARITAKSAQALALAPGMAVQAHIKGAALLA